MQKPSEKTIAQYALDSARRFNLAAQRCEETRLNPITGLPEELLLCEAIVCYAFSIEVCFKAILRYEAEGVQMEHGLSKIFSQLSVATQNCIKSKLGDPKFDAKLDDISNDFIKWRYVYEAQAAGKDIDSWVGFLKTLSNVTIETAKTIIPPPPPQAKLTQEQQEQLEKVVAQMMARGN